MMPFLLTGETRPPKPGEHYVVKDGGELRLCYRFMDDDKFHPNFPPHLIAYLCDTATMIRALTQPPR